MFSVDKSQSFLPCSIISDCCERSLELKMLLVSVFPPPVYMLCVLNYIYAYTPNHSGIYIHGEREK